MTTVLDKDLKRLIQVDGAEYTVILGPDGLRMVPKGRRKAVVELLWRDLVSGDAALAVALNASLAGTKPPATRDQSLSPPSKQPRRDRSR